MDTFLIPIYGDMAQAMGTLLWRASTDSDVF